MEIGKGNKYAMIGIKLPKQFKTMDKVGKNKQDIGTKLPRLFYTVLAVSAHDICRSIAEWKAQIWRSRYPYSSNTTSTSIIYN